MEKEFVPYELAIKLKELGFEDECMAYYSISLTEVEHEEDGTSGPFGWKQGEVTFEKRFFINNYKGIDSSNENWLESAAPLFQQAFRFFREKYLLFHWITPMHDDTTSYYYEIIDESGTNKYESINSLYQTPDKSWRAYEEAELACLEKLIEIVENQK
jgi:hypothetical protein